jgi:hypothetical protein
MEVYMVRIVINKCDKQTETPELPRIEKCISLYDGTSLRFEEE